MSEPIDDGLEPEPCPHCKGTKLEPGMEEDRIVCTHCNGSGYDLTQPPHMEDMP